MLQVRDGDRWRTVHLFDNAHETSEHHEHAYVGFVKQQPPIGVWRGDSMELVAIVFERRTTVYSSLRGPPIH